MTLHRSFTLLLGSIVLLAGCGGSGDEGTSDAASSTPKAPTAQVQQADASTTKANVIQVVNEVEACAAQDPDGSYAGCLDRPDPSLGDVAGTVSITPGPDPKTSYAVSIASGGSTFTETRGADGSITKTCAPASAAGCTNGRWG